MEGSDIRDADHLIDIERRSDISSTGPDRHHDEEGASSSSALPTPPSSLLFSNGANSRNSPFTRRSEGSGRRRRNPFNSGIWILIKLVFTLSQIIASTIVLSLSRHEDRQVFAWAIVYASGCVATLPLLCWRFLHRNQGTEQDSTQARQDAPQNNPPPEPSPFGAISITQGTDEEARQTVSSARNAQSVRISARVTLCLFASHCFSLLWLTVGNLWIFIHGKHFSSDEAPNLYRFCMLFLKICCVVYPWAYMIIYCTLLCTIILAFHENRNHTRGATAEIINVLPIYKFKLKKNGNGDDRDANVKGVGDGGGTLAAGTEKERLISGEDAECSICLAEYADDETLRELPCAHLFHVDCVDTWLKKNASCPLCKRGIGKNSGNLQTSAANPNHQR
ncbi:E3 ubiquitin-protein ligase At1g63170-like [Papaver somniferum]|uniref:E3 ubiquitin-protein ligase At1g63170-like n=1 Tax=Papaver somniferum TaxID=3469 RepID=UPI000E6FA029|nr:E3 ubiquitin-protein ligase At1g63170-like [Papaver somniferum]XP_026408444.1 E3 ubiquitin-protein ligase At1g63170-like [Papaver somniferum]XP_026408445.1 E3 ubiquitin-protein ligase At1g63170-like [Papaver somniferum]XP_026408446.1 E3 ubiquitin-protein ligase At1g63170-like [Papaver somniferum]XP_026408448.1 E3 ubiquitin-protein ligase At1g63170-like [Papaver somniferum]XP_026408449.1 E3 ubiquitin-protein ligase At1g63170-like [Papaver somniferum]